MEGQGVGQWLGRSLGHTIPQMASVCRGLVPVRHHANSTLTDYYRVLPVLGVKNHYSCGRMTPVPFVLRRSVMDHFLMDSLSFDIDDCRFSAFFGTTIQHYEQTCSTDGLTWNCLFS